MPHELITDSLEYEAGSFRDSHARIFYADSQVFRCLSPHALAQWERLRRTRFFHEASAQGSLVATTPVPLTEVDGAIASAGWAGVLRHERVPFISYAYEWCFGMLRDAALFQLDLLDAALDEGMTLKDATPYNIQWTGAQPVFIDMASVVALEPGEPWIGYRQFCQMFLYPLMLQAYRNVSFHAWLRGSIEGIEPRHCWNMMSLRDVFRRGVFTHVYLHSLLQSKYNAVQFSTRREIRTAGFNRELIQSNVRRLRRTVERLAWRECCSEWSEYAAHNRYSDQDHESKAAFLQGAMHGRQWKLVWDLGCNTGTFARLAARHAKQVVALDRDHLAIERLYQSLKQERNRSILPLVYNIADPSPGLGWRLQERQSLATRGQPDLILCLALIHHLVLSANIPLPELIDWLTGWGAELVIEFVGENDPMTQTLLLNREGEHQPYTEALFERCVAERCRVLRRTPICGGNRVMYHLAPASSV